MSNIITNTEFANLKAISKKYDNDKVEQCITQAHIDLRGVLGDAFYFDVIKNQATYGDLLNGSEFTVSDFTYVHDGLKSLVADYAYSRYLYEVNHNHTPFGMVNKNSNDSTPVDRGTLKDLVKQSNQDAAKKWSLIEDYLNANETTFEVWAMQNAQCGTPTNNSNGFNSTKISILSTGKRKL
jgi:hydrogenase maturation factor HypE